MIMERNIQLFSDNHPLISAPPIHHQTGARRALQPINADEQAIDIGVMTLLAIKQEQLLATGCGLFGSLVEAEPHAAHEVPTAYRSHPVGMPRTPYKLLNLSIIPISAPSPDVSFKPITASKPLQPSTPVKSASSFGCSGCQVALFAVIPESDASTSSNSSRMEFPSPPKSSDTTPRTSPLQTSRKAPSVSAFRSHSSSSLGSDTESSMIPLPLDAPLVALPAAPLPCPRTPLASPPPAVPSSSIQTPASRQSQINGISSLIMRTVCYHLMTTWLIQLLVMM